MQFTEKIKRHFTRRQLRDELAVEGRVVVDDVGFEFNHADGKYWLYSIHAEKATDGTVIGWAPSNLTTYECDSRQEAINRMLSSVYGTDEGKKQSKIEFQRNKMRIVLHDIDVDDESITNFDISGVELIEVDGDTAFLDVLPGYWYVHKVNGLGEYEYGIGIESVKDGNQWIDKFYDDRPMK